MKFLLFVLAFLVFILPTKVYADISLLVHEAKGFSGEMTGDGHITVYLSNLCTDPPLILRECRPHETKGVVISTYPGVGANADYKWFVIPAMTYLYGIENDSQIPLYANSKIRNFLRESNRAEHLSKQIPRLSADKMPAGRWSALFAAALDRDLYAFTVKTTTEQDLRFLNKYNISPKGNDFNVLTNNCADFTKDVINFYFPHSASRDFINDFGITTPKALARTFKNYAAKKPELLFHINKYSQLDGTIARSSDIQNFTEIAFKSKKYIALQLLTMPTLLPVFAGTYFLSGGNFNVDAAYRKFPSPEMAKLNLEKGLLKNNKQDENKAALDSIKLRQITEQNRFFGEKDTWKNYRREFSEMLKKAVQDGLFKDNGEVKSFYDDLESNSEPFFDNNGDLMLKVNNYGKQSLLGLTRRNIADTDSDVRLAYKLMLVKIRYELNAPEKNRETLKSFQANWQLLMELSKRSAELPPAQNPNKERFSSGSNEKADENKILRFLKKISH